MSTLTAVPGGYTVTGAHRIIVNLSLSPATVNAMFQVKFPRTATTGGKSLSSSLIRDLSDGSQQFTSIALSAPTADIEVPLGTFMGRKVVWNLKEGVQRTLSIKVTSIDGLGIDETWHLELCVCVPADGSTNFDARATAPEATITSVDVTPGV